MPPEVDNAGIPREWFGCPARRRLVSVVVVSFDAPIFLKYRRQESDLTFNQIYFHKSGQLVNNLPFVNKLFRGNISSRR